MLECGPNLPGFVVAFSTICQAFDGKVTQRLDQMSQQSKQAQGLCSTTLTSCALLSFTWCRTFPPWRGCWKAIRRQIDGSCRQSEACSGLAWGTLQSCEDNFESLRCKARSARIFFSWLHSRSAHAGRGPSGRDAVGVWGPERHCEGKASARAGTVEMKLLCRPL